MQRGISFLMSCKPRSAPFVGRKRGNSKAPHECGALSLIRRNRGCIYRVAGLVPRRPEWIAGVTQSARAATSPHDNSSGMAQPSSSATQGQARTNRTQLPYMRDTNHPSQVLHHRLRRRSPSPLHTRPIPHQSRAATPTTQTHQHRTLTTDIQQREHLLG